MRIVNRKNVNKFSHLVYRLFRFQEFFTRIIEVENPCKTPCIYAMWHAHQFCIYGICNREKINVLISRSSDGEIIADVVEKLGFKTIRGSQGKKGAVEASMNMISVLKNGENCAMMVDGPRGPARKVKSGIIKIAKLSGAPIVPIYWHSTNPTWVKFPSWDKMRSPILATNMINLYGEPIYVSPDDDIEEARIKLQNSLEDLEKRAQKKFYEVFKFGIWLRKK